MFPATPVWERGRKRRGSGRRMAPPPAPEAERRTFAPEEPTDEPITLDTPAAAAALGTPGYMGASRPAYEPATPATEDESLVAPIARADRQPRSRGMGAGAAVVGVAAAAALIAAGGWYMLRDRSGVPELSPGQPTATVATAPLTTTPPTVAPTPPPTTPEPTQVARAEPTPAPTRTERRASSTTARARPASSSSAAESGVNASAALPDGPQPYTSLNPGATPAPVNPAPAESIPSTPPTAPPAEPPSTTTTPQPTTQSATPPQP